MVVGSNPTPSSSHIKWLIVANPTTHKVEKTMTLRVEKSTTLEDDKKESDKTNFSSLQSHKKYFPLDIIGFGCRILGSNPVVGNGLNKRIFVCIYQNLVKLEVFFNIP